MSSLNWYLRRLSLMSLEEIGHRARTAARQWLQWPKHAFNHKTKPLSDYFQLTERELNEYLARPRPTRFLELRTAPPPMAISRESAIALAEDLLEHRFTFFALHRAPLGDPILWNYNYYHHRMCPLIYAPRVDYRDERLVGDVKYIWELNRHQHFVPLAKAYHLTGDERYAAEIVSQIQSWIEQCPYMMGVNWTTAEQAAIRLISWIWAYEWIQPASCVTSAFTSQLLHSIYQHLELITQNYSRHSSANNHLIAEATGVFVTTVYFPELKHAAVWRDESHRILVREALLQNHPDGVNAEQATAYHCLVLEYLLLAGLLGEQNGFPFPEQYWQRLEKMMEFIAALMDCRGRLPHIGDDDNGLLVQLGESSVSRARSLLATGATLFGRADFAAMAPEFDERTYWLLGGSPTRRRSKSQPAVWKESRAFESGYYIMRAGATADDEVVAVFDCGPLGYGSLAAHGHADALSLTLTVAGREILVDPGTYCYHSEKVWRDYFRSTAAHNTIRIDQVDQSVITGNFMWSEKADAFLQGWESNAEADVVKGYHTGYLRLTDPVTHQREVAFDKKRHVFRITDRIEAAGEHLVEQFFHFSEACQVRRSHEAWEIENDGVRVRLHLDEQLEQMLVQGQETPPLGWRSYTLGQKHPIPTVVGRRRITGPCQFITTITIQPSAFRRIVREGSSASR